MEKYFSVGEAARAVGMTAETLRHYDRIGLVKPSKIEKRTGYRYYTQREIVLLNTVHALQQMDLPLQRIKEVLEYDDLEKIIAFFEETERKADEKIALIQYGKAKIQLAKADYQNKLKGFYGVEQNMVKAFPERVILLSDTLETPSLDNLWSYLSHFYDKIAPSQRKRFSFEDLAGIYSEKGRSRLFATCIRCGNADGLKILPAGDYLCADCVEENREARIAELLQAANGQYHAEPGFVIQQIAVTGILSWKYQIQVPLNSQNP